jgi:serine/threonine protein kinase
MEKCEKDLLIDVIESPGHRYSEVEAIRVFKQILKGLKYCHSRKIIHGDIKPENILISIKRVIKLTDFSSSIYFDRSSLSSSYVAPELRDSSDQLTDSFMPSIDVWGAGVTLFVMCSGTIPWKSTSYKDKDFMRFMNDPESFMPSFFSKDLKSLLFKMLLLNPTHRPSISECLLHPWILNSYPNNKNTIFRSPNQILLFSPNNEIHYSISPKKLRNLSKSSRLKFKKTLRKSKFTQCLI